MTNTPLEVFTITPGRRYRFRLINSFGSVCPSQITIEGHTLTLIATDGEAVQPVAVDTIISFSGKSSDCLLLTVFITPPREGKRETNGFFDRLAPRKPRNVTFHPVIYRRAVRLRYKRRSTGWRVLDPSSSSRWMRYTTRSTVGYIAIRSGSLSTVHQRAFLWLRSSSGSCKYSFCKSGENFCKRFKLLPWQIVKK